MIQKIYHYSRHPVETLFTEFYEKYKAHWPEDGAMKPCGLWVSVEDFEDDTNWYDWCVSEKFRIGALRHKYRVILKNAKILYLKSEDDIVQFSHLYAKNDPSDFGRYVGRQTAPYISMISWAKVKKYYDGIIIAPYQWNCRHALNTAWYYPWDCASGCIWNLEKVSLELECLIDVDSIGGKKESEWEESVKGLLSAGLALLESSVRLVHTE